MKHELPPNPSLNADVPGAGLRRRNVPPVSLFRQATENGAYLLPNPTECKHEAGTFVPVIDRNRCEGKGECARVCPVGFYKVDSLPKEMRSALSIKGKIKGFAHRWQQALLVNAEACEACGLCIKACPEDAITLARAK